MTHSSGEDHPNWKGGWKYWQDGHVGTDPHGLKWAVQKKLARERDQHTCQHCGFTKPGWNPAVHHIDPYRLSPSHALDNLVCLCQSCHVKADNLIRDYGTPVAPRAPKYPPCRDCGITSRKINTRGYCGPCSPKHRDEPKRPKTPQKYCSYCQRRIRESLGGKCSICKRKNETDLVKSLLEQGSSPSEVMSLTGLSRSSVHRYRQV